MTTAEKVSMRKQIVVAGGVSRALNLAAELGLDHSTVLACSPRSVKAGAGRGLTADIVLVDDTAWPLGDAEGATLRATLIGSGGQMYQVSRVVPDGANAPD